MFGVFGIWVCAFGIWEVDLAPLPLLLGISGWFSASGFGSIPDSQFSIFVLIHFPRTNSQHLLIVWWTQILDPVLATVASLSNLQNLRKSGVAKKIAESQNRACPEWRCLYNNGGKAERSPVSHLLNFFTELKSKLYDRTRPASQCGTRWPRRLEDAPLHQGAGKLCRLPPFHRLTPPCPFGAGAAGDARGGEVDHSKHDLLQVGLQTIMGIFKLTFGVHLWQSIDTLEIRILLIQIHSRFALGPYW